MKIKLYFQDCADRTVSVDDLEDSWVFVPGEVPDHGRIQVNRPVLLHFPDIKDAYDLQEIRTALDLHGIGDRYVVIAGNVEAIPNEEDPFSDEEECYEGPFSGEDICGEDICPDCLRDKAREDFIEWFFSDSNGDAPTAEGDYALDMALDWFMDGTSPFSGGFDDQPKEVRDLYVRLLEHCAA
jgi:hypothetical protein